MRAFRCISIVTLAAFLSAAIPHAATAGSPTDGVLPAPRPTSSPLRQSIERASERAAAQVPGVPARPARPVRKQLTGGGGGGGGMMVMTLLMTAASLAGTYFLVKELKKSNDEAANNAQ